jgi:hypothetical protein
MWTLPNTNDKDQLIEGLAMALEDLYACETQRQNDWEKLLVIIHRHMHMFNDHEAFARAVQCKRQECAERWSEFDDPFVEA